MQIIHLSDIHFRRRDVTTALDPNFHLRNEILRDVAEFREGRGPADLLVISGDTAFAGHPDEFEYATEWLKQVCQACGADFRNVFVVPGNHDVVRDIADGELVQLIHNRIKQTPENELKAKIADYLQNGEITSLLYKSLNNYNVFANQFFCDMLPPDRTRATRDFKLNDGSTLRLWGINSAFVSSSRDTLGELFVDPATFQITRHAGVINMVVTHHHPSWLRQRQDVEDHFGDVAHIQVFGHIHTNRIERDPHYLRLTASALHPEQNEARWEPGYNIIKLDVEGGGQARRLHVETHVRVWQRAPGQFRAKMDRQRESFEHWIDLEPWEAGDVTDEPDTVMEEGTGTQPAAPVPGAEAMTLLRELGIRFYSLSFSQKSEIAGRLDLLKEEDITQPDFERFRRVFLRASEQNRLAELKQAIEEAEEQTRR